MTQDHAAVHLADFTAPVGPDTYVEILAPTTPDHSVARWLRRVGGASGWVLSTQVPSLDGVKERAAAHGVRIAVETQAMGRTIIQLHPLDVGVRPARHRPRPRSRYLRRTMQHPDPLRLTRPTEPVLTGSNVPWVWLFSGELPGGREFGASGRRWSQADMITLASAR